jgi:hypothetical protein
LKISTGTKGAQPLWARAKKVAAEAVEKRETEEAQAVMMPNRLALLLDVSGSMGQTDGSTHTKIELLRLAYNKFLESISYSDTSIAVETFPYYAGGERHYGSDGLRIHLTSSYPLLFTGAAKLEATGGTPMHSALDYVLQNYPVTRCVLISDGEADSPSDAIDKVKLYASAETHIDCCHIGSSTGGESLLKEIAERTGGIYIKFRDVEAFVASLSYLTPRFRAMLTSGQVGTSELGANEVRFLGSGGRK